jgi:hypothetical protein
MKGYALFSIVGFTCIVMSACIASTEPPEEARSGERIDGMGSSAQTLNCIPDTFCGPDDLPTDPPPLPPGPQCPRMWVCNWGLEWYDSWSACNAQCWGTCDQDFMCGGDCYCP